jgi:hypothetical protein
VAAGELQQRAGQAERRRVELKQLVLEKEPEVARHLVVTGTAGVEPLACSGRAAGEPVFDGGMYVLVTLIELQPALRDGAQHLTQPPAHPGVLRRADQPRRAQPFNMPQASQHVPLEQPSVPHPVLAGGVLQHSLIEIGGSPQGSDSSHPQFPER